MIKEIIEIILEVVTFINFCMNSYFSIKYEKPISMFAATISLMSFYATIICFK
jgi:hypothetical protein